MWYMRLGYPSYNHNTKQNISNDKVYDNIKILNYTRLSTLGTVYNR